LLVGYGGLRCLIDGQTELLYGLARAAWGKGYATEFATVAFEFAFGTVRLGRLVGFADPQNHASRHVLEKLGFAFEGEGLEFGMKVVRYGLENKRRRV
jgi:RimJ/RimL family protein N-acetyltransferase